MTQYPHLAARVFNTPLLIHPQKLDAILAGLGPRLLGTQTPLILAPGSDGAQLLPADLFSTRKGQRASDERGYKVVDGVAVIGINGPLLHRSRFDMADSSFMLGYNDIVADVEDAMNHPDVHAVLKVWNSPGGEADGAFEFADRMAALRGKKPMVSIADGLAASAAYLGASASDEIVVTTTGYVGSIGVVMRHVDFSQALAAEGIKVTHIFAGAHKVDGNPYQPLPDAVRADFQAEIDGLMSMFVDSVAQNTGLDPMAIRKTQAATYRGVSAVASGLASRVGTTDSLIAELAALRSRSYPSGQTARATANQGDSMSGNTPAGGQPAAQTTANPNAAANVAPAATTENTMVDAGAISDLQTAARAEGHAQGVAAERARVGSILGHERAGAHMAVALQCINTGLSVEQSGAILSALPEQAPAATVGAQRNTAFDAAMAAVGNPKVTGIEASDGQSDLSGDEAAASAVLAAFRLTQRA